MDKKSQTIHTYNKSAIALAQKFDNLGVRISDILETFALINKQNPRVLEIGCGNGRDAKEIIKKTNDYLGVDVSEKLIDLARVKVPEARFEVADIISFKFPKNIDIVFAFASLIHVDKDELKVIFMKIFNSLNQSGVVRISLKYSDEYKEVTEESEFGIRTYYYYSQDDIKELVGDLTIIKSEILEKRETVWFEVTLQKM